MDVQVKQRLTGAVILVAGLVLLIPELLTGPGEGAVRRAAAEGAVPLRAYTLDLSDPERSGELPESAPPAPILAVPAPRVASASAAAPSAAAPERPVPATRAATAKPVTSAKADPAPKPASASKPDPAPRSQAPPKRVAAAQPARAAVATATPPVAARPTAAAAPASGQWMVQVGSFSSRANAERLVRDLEGKGFQVLLTESARSGRRLFRVRVGPPSARDAALALADRLRASGQTGAVVSRN